jgi:hypothetical protein
VSMTDLDVAKSRIRSAELTLVVVKDNRVILESKLRGVSGFLEAIYRLGDQFEGASVADKVVGKAIALMCLYSKVKSIYAQTLSQKAKIFLEENEIHLEWDTLVRRILNDNKTKTCPFEELIEKVDDPTVAYGKLVRACSVSRT